MRRHTIPTVLSALVLAASLSACGGDSGESGTPASGSAGGSTSTAPAPAAESSQSVEEGCSALETEFKALSEKYKDVDTNDQAAAMEAFGKMMEEMKGVGGSVGNADVKSAWDGFLEGFSAMSESAGGDMTTQSGIDESMARLDEASKKMDESMTKLNSLCPNFKEASDQLEGTTSGN